MELPRELRDCEIQPRAVFRTNSSRSGSAKSLNRHPPQLALDRCATLSGFGQAGLRCTGARRNARTALTRQLHVPRIPPRRRRSSPCEGCRPITIGDGSTSGWPPEAHAARGGTAEGPPPESSSGPTRRDRARRVPSPAKAASTSPCSGESSGAADLSSCWAERGGSRAPPAAARPPHQAVDVKTASQPSSCGRSSALPRSSHRRRSSARSTASLSEARFSPGKAGFAARARRCTRPACRFCR